MTIQQLETELWEAADQLRANSKLTAAEYSMPVLGLIFLRHAGNRFQAYLPEIEAGIPARVPADRREALIRLAFQGKAAVYLPEAARFERIAGLPRGSQVGEAIDAAMEAIEAEYTVLQGALPHGYAAFEPDLLAELVKIFDRPAIRSATGDVFGRIYEYFLNKFAMSGEADDVISFIPPSLIRLIVNVIEPDHGLVLDPAYGSAGMFVQTGHFIEDVRHQLANDRVTFPRTGEERHQYQAGAHEPGGARTGRLQHPPGQHLLRGDQAPHRAVRFRHANPPFNVDGVIEDRIKPQHREGGRLPFGLPGTNAKTKAISNANSLWLQYFHAYLNDTGRAGFVMASSASDAGNKDRDIRERLVETGHVDVMIAIGTKFFYTRSLPCTLWFYDKGKQRPVVGAGVGVGGPALNDTDHVLMIDARHVYHVVSARSHVFTDEQLANLTAIVWLYRGESAKFTALVAQYQQQVADWLAVLPERLRRDTRAVLKLAAKLRRFSRGARAVELLEPLPHDPAPTAEQTAAWQAALADTQAALDAFKADLGVALADASTAETIAALLAACDEVRALIARTECDRHAGQVALQVRLESLIPRLKSAGKALEARHKTWLALLDQAEKGLRARLSKSFDGRAVREARRALLAADARKNEAPTARDAALEALRQAVYFIQQVHWLHSRFPEAVFVDVPGLCKAVRRAEIAAGDYSLTPGRYVGVAAASADDEDDFVETLREIHDELVELNDRAVELAGRIGRNLEALLV